ncbi:DUF624 domain-containing protein [Enterococcus sp. LJL90]
MFKKQSFENNIYMKIFRWVYILLIGNLLFSLVNIPFFFAAVCLALDVRNIPLFALSLLFVGPATIALLHLIDRFKEEKDVEPVKEFFKGFRKLGIKGLIFWLIGWFGIIIGVTDMIFFAEIPQGQWLIPFFILLVTVALAITINSWYFQVRNPNSPFKDVLRMASYFALRKWYVSIVNVILFALIFVLMLLKPQFGFILTPALFMGIIYLNATQLHKVKNATSNN